MCGLTFLAIIAAVVALGAYAAGRLDGMDRETRP